MYTLYYNIYEMHIVIFGNIYFPRLQPRSMHGTYVGGAMSATFSFTHKSSDEGLEADT